MSFVPRERMVPAFTIYISFVRGELATLRAARIGDCRRGEQEMPRFRKPEGPENWAWVVRQAELLRSAAWG